MTKITREHLAGLELALESGAVTSPDMRESVRKMIAQASAAPEQEPFGYMRPEGVELVQRGDYGSVHHKVDGYHTIPVFTHADPSEVERLRAEVERLRLVNGGNLFCAQVMSDLSDDQEEELVLLRQQLSEAQALLHKLAANPTGSIKHYIGSIDAFLSATAQPAEDENAARMAYIEEHGAPDSMRQIHPVQGERYWSYDQGETRYPTAAEAIDAARLKPAEVKS